MFPVVPVFRGLVRRRSLRGVRHGGQVVGDGDAAGNDALHGRWDASRRDAHHPGGVPGGGTQRGRVCHGPDDPASPAEATEGRGTERCHFSASIGRGSVAISHFMCVTQLPDPSLCAKLSPIVAINAGTATYMALPTSSTAGGVVPKPKAGICCNQTLVVFALGWF